MGGMDGHTGKPRSVKVQGHHTCRNTLRKASIEFIIFWAKSMSVGSEPEQHKGSTPVVTSFSILRNSLSCGVAFSALR